VRRAGTVACWGKNNMGQCSPPGDLTNAVAVAAGASHTAAVLRDGTVRCWGDNTFGKCSVPEGCTGTVAVAAGLLHTTALLGGGRVRCWGGNTHGQINVPPGLTNAVAVAACGTHSAALTADGRVLCWGYPGVTNVPACLTNAVAVAAGLFHAAALTADGDIVCWGDNAYGQTNTPSGMGAVTAVGAGQYHTLARTSGGEIVCWGDNAYGQSETNLPGVPVRYLGGGVSYSLALAGHRPLFTDPLDADTDGDGMPDGWEAGHGGFDPLAVQADGTHGAGDDPDGDGLDNAVESGCGTDPSDGDTDGDLVQDGAEVPHSAGSCPNDAGDGGDPANCVTLRLTVGDPSGSHSERWNMDVSEYPSGRAVIRHCDGGFGTPGSAEYALVKGKAYAFRLRWVATDPGYTGTPRPDYDWQCLVNDSAAEGARTGLYGTGAFTVEDPGGLLTGETHGNETDITVGKEGRIIVPKLDILPDGMTGLVELDDGDDDSRTRTFVVPVAQPLEFPVQPVTVRAILIPGGSEESLPASWTLQGGNGTDRLLRTVDRSAPSKTEFAFTFNGFDSGLKTTVYVYDAEVGLYADEGNPPALIEVGHSWGIYSLDNYSKQLIPVHLYPYLDKIGFWPTIHNNPSCQGEVKLGADAQGSHPVTGSKTYPIAFTIVEPALAEMDETYQQPFWYNLFSFNCTDFAIWMGEVVNVYTLNADGVTTPQAFSVWLNTH